MVKNYFGILGFDEVETPQDIENIRKISEGKLEDRIKWKFERLIKDLDYKKMYLWPNMVDCASPKELIVYSAKLKKEAKEAYDLISEKSKREEYIAKVKGIKSFEKSNFEDIKSYLD